MNKIVCCYEYPIVKKQFSQSFQKEDITFFKGGAQDISQEKKTDKVEVLSVFISSVLDKKNIDKFPNLKLIVTRSTGMDHIDLEYAKKKGIAVKNIANYGDISIAEYSFALLFEIAKKISLANMEVRINQNFSARGIHAIESFDLYGKTIGVIGTGKIGKKFIKISQGFGMRVLAYDKFKDEKFAQENNFEYVSLKKLLKESDIISLHLPLLKSTRHIIAQKEFEAMKDGVVILNTARGGLMCTKDLLEALKSKKVSAAGLDVLENEDCLGRESYLSVCEMEMKSLNKKLIAMENVIVTPHNAFNSKEASERRIQMSIETIQEYLKN